MQLHRPKAGPASSHIFVFCGRAVGTNCCFSHGLQFDFTITIAAVSIALNLETLFDISKFLFIVITKHVLTLTPFLNNV